MAEEREKENEKARNGSLVWKGTRFHQSGTEKPKRRMAWGKCCPPPQSWVSKKNLVDWELRVEEKLGEVRGHRCAGHR